MRTLGIAIIIKKVNQILTGYYYYGIIDNWEMNKKFSYITLKSRFFWLNRGSQKKSYNWGSFLTMIDEAYLLVSPQLYVKLLG